MFAVYQAACRTTNINSVYTRYSFPRDLWPRRRAVREPISRRNSFSPPRRPIFNSKRRNELFSAPFQRIYPPSPAEFRDAGSSLGSHLRHDPTRHHVNSIRDGSSLANNFELRAVSRVYMYVCIPCTRIICTRVCVRMCTYVRRSLVPVQRSKPTNPLPRGQQEDARIHIFFFSIILAFPFRRSSLRFAFAFRSFSKFGDIPLPLDSRAMYLNLSIRQINLANSKISFLSSQESKRKKEKKKSHYFI